MSYLGLNRLFGRGSIHETKIKDPFVGSDLVAGLDRENFTNYIKSKDVALVMFYDPTDIDSEWSSKHFKRAAEVTRRPNHAYAAVNCDKNPDFCVTEGVPYIPHFKIYSRGEKVKYNVDARKMRYQDMKQWVETVPVSVKGAGGDHGHKNHHRKM